MAAVSLAENGPQRYPLRLPQALPRSTLARVHGHTGAPRVRASGVKKVDFKIFRIRDQQLANHEKSNEAGNQIRALSSQRAEELK